MARSARREVIDPDVVQVLHCTQRCVRRAFLCGDDPVTRKSFEHRRGWIVERLKLLASVFGIDCLTYAVMSNHLHLVLRSRPDVVMTWSDHEVARRWLRLFPKHRRLDDSRDASTQAELDRIVNNPKRVRVLRRRLSDISWWMRCVSEHIARRSNKEDNCRGRFWEGRFGCQVLLDEASLLACAAYVDLNPVRAALADTPESSQFTGIKDRVDDLLGRSSERPELSSHERERIGCGAKSGWLSPLEIDDRRDQLGPDADPGDRRASRKGFLRLTLDDYLLLLDWTGRELRADKRGSIPSHLEPILQRLGLNPAGWCDAVGRFRQLFKRAAGAPTHLAEEARRRGLKWLQAPGSKMVFAPQTRA